MTIASGFALSLVIAALLGTGLHLVWLLPLSFVLPVVPFSGLPAKAFYFVVTIGLNQDIADKKRSVIREFGGLLVDGMSEKQAFEAVRDRYPELVRSMGPDPFIAEAEFVSSLDSIARAGAPAGDESEDERWERYIHTPNSPALLREKGSAFASTLVGMAARRSSELQPTFPLENEIALTIEYLIVLLHLMDRHAFNQLGAERRDLFVDPLVAKAVDCLVSEVTDPADASNFREKVEALYWERVDTYKDLKVFAEGKGEGDRWGSTIGFALAEMLGNDSPASGLELMLAIADSEMFLVKEMRIREVIGN